MMISMQESRSRRRDVYWWAAVAGIVSCALAAYTLMGPFWDGPSTGGVPPTVTSTAPVENLASSSSTAPSLTETSNSAPDQSTGSPETPESSSPLTSNEHSASPTSQMVTPVAIWPHIVSDMDMKDGNYNLDGRTSGAGDSYATCVSFGTNPFQETRSVTIYIPHGAKSFTATLGETKESDPGAVITRIELNGQTIASYTVSYYDRTPISVPVSGQSLMKLTVTIAKGGGSIPSNQSVLYGDARFNA